MNETAVIIKEDSQTSSDVRLISELYDNVEMAFSFLLISGLVEMKGYLSFPRQISAINAPKAMITVITCNRSIMIS